MMKNILIVLLLMSSFLVQADELIELITGKSKAVEAIPDKVISVENTEQVDDKIQKRIQEIFFESKDLSEVIVTVNSGVVTLEGNVNSNDLETKALKLASQVEGTVNVENKITINRSIETRLENVTDKTRVLGEQLFTSLPVFLLALAVVIIFWWIGYWLGNLKKLYKYISPNAFIASLLAQVVHVVVVIIGIILALVLLDATDLIGTVLGAAGIVGLAIGFAVRDTVENYIASILLSIRNPFEVNDFVEINGQGGNVLFLTSRATILISADGNHIRIPNAMVFKAIIINYTRNPERRFQFDVEITAEQDFTNTRAIILEALSKAPGLLSSPKPSVIIGKLHNSNMLICIYAWVNQEKNSLDKVRSEAIRIIKQYFDAQGIVIPEPTYKLKMHNIEEISKTKSRVERLKSAVPKKIKVTDDNMVQDVTPDLTVATKVIEEQSQGGKNNLLSPSAPKEI